MTDLDERNGGAGGPAPDRRGLLDAVTRYERALMSDDLPALDELFTPGPATLRADATNALVGSTHIAEFRAGRGGAPRRWLRRVHLRWIGPDDAYVVAESDRVGGHGVQTQWWHRDEVGARDADDRRVPPAAAGIGRRWRVQAAHVSGGPAPAGLGNSARPGAGEPVQPPAGESAVWRVRGAGRPLAGGGPGPLAGVRVAVKDLVAVAGQRVGAGVPAWLGEAPVEPRSAPALQRLLDLGAHVEGIAQTDELAFSLMGVNEHYGTPWNAAAPGRVPGGSSSGPAAAVAAGSADLGLGTDTAGSLRVPGSYCGLYAWRPTHAAVPVDGVLPLAEDFDTVGLLARQAALLRTAGLGLLGAGQDGHVATTGPTALWRSQTLMDLATPETALAVDAALTALSVATGLPLRELEIDPGAPAAWTRAFRTVQTAQAWANHGAFLTAHPGAVSTAVRDRFASGASVSPQDLVAARESIQLTRGWLDDVLAGGWLCLPSTATPAPPVDSTAAQVEEARTGTLLLSTLASQTGVPALNLPWGRVGQLPVGLCVLAPRGADTALLDLLETLGPPG